MTAFLFNQHLQHLGMTYRVDVDQVVRYIVTYEFQTEDDPQEVLEDMISSGNYSELEEINSEEIEIRDFDIINIEKVDDL